MVFVGGVDAGPYSQALQREAQGFANVIITGFVTAQQYQDWLTVAQLGVQLRVNSRGETSAALFDCLSAGLLTAYNAYGSAAELAPHVGIRLPDRVSVSVLSRLFESWLRGDLPLLRPGATTKSRPHPTTKSAPRSATKAEPLVEFDPWHCLARWRAALERV